MAEAKKEVKKATKKEAAPKAEKKEVKKATKKEAAPKAAKKEAAPKVEEAPKKGRCCKK